MIRWNLFQLKTWLYRCVVRIYTGMFIEIKHILNDEEKTSKLWFKLVKNVWDDNCYHVVNLNSVQELYDINGNIFIRWDGDNESNTW